MRNRSRPAITRHCAAHVTLKLREGLRTLRDGRIVRAIEETFRRGAERPGFRLTHFTIQPDHLHLIVEADDRRALARGMMSLATRVALAVNRVLQRRGPVLRERYHLRVLHTPLEVRRWSNAAPDVARPPPARARSWLLRVGWRRHGLLDPSEVPG